MNISFFLTFLLEVLEIVLKINHLIFAVELILYLLLPHLVLLVLLAVVVFLFVIVFLLF